MRGFIKQAKSKLKAFGQKVGSARSDEHIVPDLPALLLDSRRIASALYNGNHHLKRSGQGYDFWQFRPYQPGDDPRRIDWRQSARGDSILLREKEQSNMQTALVYVDNTPSMRYGQKSPHAFLCAASTINALAMGNERFGLLEQSGSDIGLGHSKSHCERVIAFLQDKMVRPSQTLEIRQHIPQNCCAIFISDFLSPLHEIQATLKILAQRCSRVIALQILDHDEVHFHFSGHTVFTDMQQIHNRDFDAAETIADHYKSKLRSHLNAFDSLCRHYNITHLFHETGQPVENAAKDLWQALHSQNFKQKATNFKEVAA